MKLTRDTIILAQHHDGTVGRVKEFARWSGVQVELPDGEAVTTCYRCGVDQRCFSPFWLWNDIAWVRTTRRRKAPWTS